MGLFDKFKKKEDDFGDLSDLGDFGLDDKSSGGGMDSPGGLDDMGGDFGAMPGFDSHPSAPPAREEVMPTQASRDMGDQFGLTPPQNAPASHPPQQHTQQPMQQQSYQPQPQMQQQYQAQQQMQHQMMQPSMQGGFDLGDLMKDMEIVHAKLDAIKSSLDSINQRLATLERIANPETKNRYSW